MKRLVIASLVLVALGQIMWSQATRQADPRAAIDEAAAQLALINASHARLMVAVEKLVVTSYPLYTKAYAVCGIRDKITNPDAVKAVGELCTTATQFQQQLATLQ